MLALVVSFLVGWPSSAPSLITLGMSEKQVEAILGERAGSWSYTGAPVGGRYTVIYNRVVVHYIDGKVVLIRK
jgi:hypothetical protein